MSKEGACLMLRLLNRLIDRPNTIVSAKTAPGVVLACCVIAEKYMSDAADVYTAEFVSVFNVYKAKRKVTREIIEAMTAIILRELDYVIVTIEEDPMFDIAVKMFINNFVETRFNNKLVLI